MTYPGPTTDTYTAACPERSRRDAVGNRTAKNSTAYVYDNADQMTAAGGVSYGYDFNGNQTSRASDAFAWDHENRLTSATIAGTGASYAYSGDGVRRSRTIGASTSTYSWDVARSIPMLLQETTASNTTTYVYGLGMIYWVDGSGNVTYRLTDGLGSTVALCNGSGTVTDSWTYDVFGAVKTHSGSNATEFTFTGEQNDPNGLEYLRARYYDSATGRFLGRDQVQCGTPYVYGANNPTNLVDRTGLYPIYDEAGNYWFDSTQVGLPAQRPIWCDPTINVCVWETGEVFEYQGTGRGQLADCSGRVEGCILGYQEASAICGLTGCPNHGGSPIPVPLPVRSPTPERCDKSAYDNCNRGCALAGNNPALNDSGCYERCARNNPGCHGFRQR